MLYFAYGSNLNLEQMARRCPAAVPVDKFYLPNARLVFRGVADVIADENFTCPGGLWRLTEQCERALDLYEGFRHDGTGMYAKHLVPVHGLPDGEREVMLYVMNSTGIFPPPDSYYNGIVQGYRDFGLKLAPLRLALKHAHDEKHPSHVERQRMRRSGRPPLAPRPQPKAHAKAQPKAQVRGKSKAKGRPAHDPWGPQASADRRRKPIMSLDEWLDMRRETGRAF